MGHNLADPTLLVWDEGVVIRTLLALILFVGVANGAPKGRLVDMVVVQVGSTVVTLSELEGETRLMLLRRGGAEIARSSLPVPCMMQEEPEEASRMQAPLAGPGVCSPTSLHKAVLRSIVHRELLMTESRRLNLPAPPEVEVERSLARIRRRFALQEDYERFLSRSGFHGIDGEEGPLAAILRMERQVERFLEVRVRINVVIDERDVMACFEANKDRFQTLTFKELEQLIRARLSGQRHRRALMDLLQQLEDRTSIRYAPGFEPPPLSKLAEEEDVGFKCPERR